MQAGFAQHSCTEADPMVWHEQMQSSQLFNLYVLIQAKWNIVNSVVDHLGNANWSTARTIQTEGVGGSHCMDEMLLQEKRAPVC